MLKCVTSAIILLFLYPLLCLVNIYQCFFITTVMIVYQKANHYLCVLPFLGGKLHDATDT